MANSRHAALPLVLDTCVLIHFLRATQAGMHLSKIYGLYSRQPRPFISTVTIAEARAFAVYNGWGDKRLETVNAFLQTLIPVEISPHDQMLHQAYIDLDVASRGAGRRMGKNDLWIAATTRALGAVLVTTDADFSHLPWSELQSEYTDPVTLTLAPVNGGPP